MKIILVCGIDTDIGKTYVTGNILEQLLRNNYKVASFKPVQTGNIGYSEDLQHQLDIAKKSLTYHYLADKIYNYVGHTHLCSYILSQPVSPHLAAKIDNVKISLDKILDDLDTIIRNKYPHTTPSKINSRQCTNFVSLDTLLIELAGGIMSPVSDYYNNLDLISLIKQYCYYKEIELKVVLVTSGRLGALSNTLACIKLLPQLDYIVYNTYIAQGGDLIQKAINQNNFEYLQSLQRFCLAKEYISIRTKHIPKHNYQHDLYQLAKKDKALGKCLSFVNKINLTDKTYYYQQPSIVVKNLLNTKIIKINQTFEQDYFID